MKATRIELLSNCCQAPLKAWSGDEGTGYYECTRCLRAADQMVPSTTAELPSSFEKKLEELIIAARALDEAFNEANKILIPDLTPMKDCEILVNIAHSLGAQEALQRVEKVIGDRLRLPVDDVMELQEELLAKLREEYI